MGDVKKIMEQIFAGMPPLAEHCMQKQGKNEGTSAQTTTSSSWNDGTFLSSQTRVERAPLTVTLVIKKAKKLKVSRFIVFFIGFGLRQQCRNKIIDDFMVK